MTERVCLYLTLASWLGVLKAKMLHIEVRIQKL